MAARKEDIFDILLLAVDMLFILLKQSGFELAAAFINCDSVTDMGCRLKDAWEEFFPSERSFEIPPQN